MVTGPLEVVLAANIKRAKRYVRIMADGDADSVTIAFDFSSERARDLAVHVIALVMTYKDQQKCGAATTAPDPRRN